ncbi:MAG: hypothetical protein VKK63_10150 [Synechococcus sp.]|nr:hypothetical protein [Synechococcus sp.]
MQSCSGWRSTLRSAVELWQAYQFEAAVQECLAYLHPVLGAPRPEAAPSLLSHAQLAIVIACGGRGSRWGDFLGLPKHMVDPGEGLPLVQRTLLQLRERFPGARLYLLLGEEQLIHFAPIQHADILVRRSHPDALLALEVLEGQSHVWDTSSGLLWLHGDVFFSDAAMQKISEELALRPDQLKCFGRKGQNQAHWNDDGEGFGWYVPNGSADVLRDWCLLTRQIYIGSLMRRLSSWEIVALISYARRQGYTRRDELVNSGQPPMDMMTCVMDHFARRDFAEDLWVEIDDETEDFEFPFEYFRRLVLRVKTSGVKLESRGR